MDDFPAIQDLTLILNGVVQLHNVALRRVKNSFQLMILVCITLAEPGAVLLIYSFNELMFFFRRKPMNRRLGREYVLDVKLRSSQVRAVRVRRATMAVSVLLGVALGAFVLWRAGHWGLDEMLYENPAFATRQIMDEEIV